MVFCDIHTHNLPASGTNTLSIINRITGKDMIPLSVWNTHLWSVGIHPWYVTDEEQQWQELQEMAMQQNVLAIGEAGLDKLVDLSMDKQLELFKKQAFLSEEVAKPLLIHCVKAWDELFAVRKEIKPTLPWIIHGFRGNQEQACQIMQQGILLSFGWNFNPEALQVVPLESLFLETDDKEITIQDVYHKIADILHISSADLAVQIRKNVAQTFSV